MDRTGFVHNERLATLSLVVDSEDAPSRRAGGVFLSNPYLTLFLFIERI